MTDVLGQLKHSLTLDVYNIERVKEENLKCKMYKLAIADAKETLTEIQTNIATLKKLLAYSVKLSKQHRDKKLSFLEYEIEKNLRYLLPEEDFRVQILFNDRAGEYTAQLEITRGDHGKRVGDWHSPRAQNGRFVRQMISFSCMYSINKLRGSKVVFSDEALASADKQSLKALKPLFDSLTDEGFQITIIEHKQELYETLDRREFHLYKDRDKQEVILKGVVDKNVD